MQQKPGSTIVLPKDVELVDITPPLHLLLETVEKVSNRFHSLRRQNYPSIAPKVWEKATGHIKELTATLEVIYLQSEDLQSEDTEFFRFHES